MASGRTHCRSAFSKRDEFALWWSFHRGPRDRSYGVGGLLIATCDLLNRLIQVQDL
ncbi:MAG: hypothetical protein ABW185_20500 [Sedimenticola sp.]